ncbi:hypothetical protein [Pseudoxanthomonas koreensis]|uniref:hypothetical protein n=1 Tax=Pseudoxanthomonas koreensis TaxID=266061 RepID=UPI0035A5AAF6
MNELLGCVPHKLFATDLLTAHARRLLNWLLVGVTNCLSLNSNVAIIKGAVIADDHSIRSDLCASRLQLRDGVRNGRVGPAGFVTLG